MIGGILAIIHPLSYTYHMSQLYLLGVRVYMYVYVCGPCLVLSQGCEMNLLHLTCLMGKFIQSRNVNIRQRCLLYE